MKDEQDKALDNLMAWQQDFDKPVAWMTDDGKIVSNREKEKYDITFGDYCIPLYTTPQIKKLSDVEIHYEVDKWERQNNYKHDADVHKTLIDFAKAILKRASEK